MIKKIPSLNLNGQNETENRSSNSSNEANNISALVTDRRYHQVKRSEDLCSNSPRRYQNYFEIL